MANKTRAAAEPAAEEMTFGPAPEAAPAPHEEPAEFPMPLDEFCVLLSQTERRATLIAAFNSDEVLNGRHADTATAYRTRFAALQRRRA